MSAAGGGAPGADGVATVCVCVCVGGGGQSLRAALCNTSISLRSRFGGSHN